MDQAVKVGVAECLPGGLDDVLAHADRSPGTEPVCGLNQHAYGGIGAVTLIKDPYLVVDQLELPHRGVGRQQRVAYGLIKSIDRTIALADNALTPALGRKPNSAFGV